jgi:hypothetical protein
VSDLWPTDPSAEFAKASKAFRVSNSYPRNDLPTRAMVERLKTVVMAAVKEHTS